MPELPYQRLDALDIMPGWVPVFVYAAIAILAAVIIYYLYKLYRRYRQNNPVKTAPLKGAKHILKQRLELINENALKSENYREACHQLSSAARFYVEKKTGIEAEEMTLPELAETFGRKDPTSFFERVSLLQFRKRVPDRSEYVSVYRHAKELADKKITLRHS